MIHSNYDYHQELGKLLNYNPSSWKNGWNVIAASKDDQGNIHFETVGLWERFCRGVRALGEDKSGLEEIKAETVARRIQEFAQTFELNDLEKKMLFDTVVEINMHYLEKHSYIQDSTTSALEGLAQNLKPKPIVSNTQSIPQASTSPMIQPNISQAIISSNEAKKDTLAEEAKEIIEKLSSFKMSDPWNPADVKELSRLLSEGYRVRFNQEQKLPENEKENMRICLQNSLALLYPKESTQSAEIIFLVMLREIQVNAKKEIIDPTLTNKDLEDQIKLGLQIAKVEYSPELKRIAAVLYPLALLTALSSEKSKIPEYEEYKSDLMLYKNQKESVPLPRFEMYKAMAHRYTEPKILTLNNDNINHEVDTFSTQYRTLFGDNCSEFWTKEFFRECMKKILISEDEERTAQVETT